MPIQGTIAPPVVKSSDDDQTIMLENPLMANIDKDIAEVAGEVRNMSAQPQLTEQHPLQQQLQSKEVFEIPIDPNLKCSKCGRQFRHGEIQKLRKHFDQCNGKL